MIPYYYNDIANKKLLIKNNLDMNTELWWQKEEREKREEEEKLNELDEGEIWCGVCGSNMSVMDDKCSVCGC